MFDKIMDFFKELDSSTLMILVFAAILVIFLIILIIAAFLQNFAQLEVIQHAFAGIRVCVCVLILQAVLRLWKSSVVDVFTLVLYLIIFSLSAFSGLLPVKIPAAVLVVLAGVAGLAASLLKNRKNASNGNASAGKEGKA